MVYNDDMFNTYGKIPTDADFWNQAIDEFVSDDGITSGFSRVLGEQVFRPLGDVRTPFYNRYAGRPIEAGVGWTERALKATDVYKFKPKATAEDNMKFYNSQGIEKTFTVNVQGWVPVSTPSNLISLDMFVKRNGIQSLNSLIVDNATKTYQRSIESEIEKKAISLTKAEMEVDTAKPVQAIQDIMNKASEMMSDDVQYNELTSTENEGLITRSDSIQLYINYDLWNAYRNAKASLPSPSELVSNVEVVPMANKLPTPLTTAEFNAGKTSNGWKDADKPVAIDEPAPVAFLCASDKIVYRPVEGSYKVNAVYNQAGDFVNTHLIYRGAVAVRPWENSVRVNAKTASS